MLLCKYYTVLPAYGKMISFLLS